MYNWLKAMTDKQQSSPTVYQLDANKIPMSTPLMRYLKQLESQGITDIEVISDKLYEHINRQIEHGVYSND